MKKKVVLLKSQMNNRGGLEKYTLRLALAFMDKECDVTLLTSDCENRPPHLQNINYINVCQKSSLSAVSLLAYDKGCRQWLKNNPCDIVFGLDRNSYQTHYRAGNGVHAAYLRLRKFSEPWFKGLSFYINPLHRLILKFEKQTYEDPRLKILFTNSHLVKQEILQYYQTDPSKIHVIHNGVEWHEMIAAFQQWPSQSEQLKFALKRDPSSFQLLFAGHGYRRKGLLFLLEGLKVLNSNQIQLSVIGKDKHLDHWHRLVHQMGLEKQVTFFGAQPTMKPFYQMADALAIPSIYDPFANVTVEGLAMGLFVISSVTNGGHEILQPHTGIKITDLYDPTCMANALNQALNHKKTPSSAEMIRSSVASLDFSSQLGKMVSATLGFP